jgi:hypothetical protein
MRPWTDSEATRRSGSTLGRDRDRELARLVGRHGALAVEQAMRATGIGRTATYRRSAALIEAGLLERWTSCAQSRACFATRDGMRYAKLAMPVAAILPGTVDHWLRCVTAAPDLGERYGHDDVLTERDILSEEVLEERTLGKIPFGRVRDYGNQRFHRPDLIVATEEA